MRSRKKRPKVSQLVRDSERRKQTMCQNLEPMNSSPHLSKDLNTQFMRNVNRKSNKQLDLENMKSRKIVAKV